MSLPRSFKLALLFAAFCAAPAAAQQIEGILVEEGGAPIPGAVVQLLDANGSQNNATLTDPGGRFVLQASAPGSYRLKAERIGYATATSPLLTVAAGEVVEHRLVAPTEAISLSGISVKGDRRCVLSPEEGLELAQVWEEARKALEATALAEAEGLIRYEIVEYERELHPRNLEVVRELRKTQAEYAQHPFASPFPAADLSREGFVRAQGPDTTYIGPDAKVLLSDAFRQDHCYHLESDRDQPERVGLAFRPTRDRKVPEVEGVLWLDRSTAELHHVDYRYSGLPSLKRTKDLGGRVEFDRLPNGLWIVSQWYIRMPMIEIRQGGQVRLARGQPTSVQESVVGIKEEGGVVIDARDRDDRFFAADQAVLSGVVWDSTRAAPLAGATVFVSGTQFSTTTNDHGRYVLQELPEGQFTVSFMHPRLDTLSALPAPQPVALVRGQASRVDLGVPAVAVEGAETERGTVVVVSRKRGGGSQARLEGEVTGAENETLTAARLTLQGQEERRVAADSRGEFRAGELEPGTYAVEVQHMGYAPKQFTVTLRDGEMARVKVNLATEPVELPGVEAVALAERRRVPAALADFYRRAERGFGYFLHPRGDREPQSQGRERSAGQRSRGANPGSSRAPDGAGRASPHLRIVVTTSRAHRRGPRTGQGKRAGWK